MLRKVLAVILGLFIGSVVNMSIIMISAVMHPMPEGVTFEDQEGMKEWIENMPPSGFIMALLAHQLGTLAAGFVAALVAKQKWVVGGIIVGACFLVGGIMTLFDFAHPTWFAILDIGLYLPMGFLGAVVGGKLVGPKSTQSEGSTPASNESTE